MKSKKLKLEDLKVQSFTTGANELKGGTSLPIDNNPTPNTGCYVCPVKSVDAECEIQ